VSRSRTSPTERGAKARNDNLLSEMTGRALTAAYYAAIDRAEAAERECSRLTKLIDDHWERCPSHRHDND
jgi:hypothetical protein